MIDEILLENIPGLIAACWKDRVSEEEQEKLRRAVHELQNAEMRTEKANATIREIVSLKAQIKRFQFTYNKMIEKTGERISGIDKCIRDLEFRIKELEIKKKNE